MPANYVLLQRIELNASAASVTFSNIPQSGYTDLKVVASAREDSASNTELRMRINGNTSSVYSTRELRGTGSAVSSFSLSGTFAVAGRQNTASSTASTFGNFEVYIPNYLSSSNKSFSSDSVTENNATLAYASLVAGLFSDTTAISSLTFFAEVGNLAANSTFSLYGLAALGTTPVIAPKATGGNITSDGTYWYHTFLSTGTFTPLQALTCDYLVVAGGGGAGGGTGGGGGAGGLRSTVTSTGGGGSLESALAVASGTAYTITVGSGGAGAQNDGGNGTQGSNSVFSSITSTGGGAGNHGSAGGSGGSGGGAGYAVSGTNAGGTATSGQGYAGGSATNTGNPLYTCGGGGGAGGAGTSVNASSNGGAGGAGIWTALTDATTTGQLSSGHYYVGGGGGGGTNGTTAAGGVGGGGSSVNDQTGVSGTINTGGGGGGAGTNSAAKGGAGGSGVVVIRYTIA